MIQLVGKIKMVIVIVSTAIVAVVLTSIVINATQVRTLKSEIKMLQGMFERQNALIIELAKIEKYKIENKFDGKLKPRDASNIIISLDNKLTAAQIDTLSNPVKAITDKSFFDKLKFWK